MIDCPFCDQNRKSFLDRNGYDVESMYFYEDQDFSISPDLSPLVTGHLLVIPTHHYASFGEIDDKRMLLRLRIVAEILLGTSDLLLFEHGAVVEGEGGASVDHAHLHIMPRPKNMTIDLIDKYRTFHLKAAEYTFFSSAHGTLSRINTEQALMNLTK